MSITFYHQHVLVAKLTLYPHEALCEQLQWARDFMNRHFAEDINLEAIASKACLSKFHFIRVFKSLYGCTPHQYLTEIRITRAKQLLQQGHNIASACYLTGFDSISSFKGLFKRYTGNTPASFTRQQQVPPVACYLPFGFALQKSNFRDSW